MPGFAYDYVDTGIDGEHGKQRNRDAWNAIELTPTVPAGRHQRRPVRRDFRPSLRHADRGWALVT